LEKLSCTLDYKLPVLRRFASVEEQNLWFEKADQTALAPFLSPQIQKNKNPSIDAPFGYGEVLHSGRIATKQLLDRYKQRLHQKKQLKETSFNYEFVTLMDDQVSYQGLKAKQIVFAEGYGLKANPFFKYLPLNGTKGELLTIKAPELKAEAVIKSAVFIIPLGEDLYRVGATYKWKDKTNTPTNASKEELITKLDRFLKCSYEVVDHVAGIRPTVEDRRPLVGKHPKWDRLYVLNGFGSRGVMIAPFAAMQLYQHIEEQQPLHSEMDIARFTAKYFGELPSSVF